MGGPDDTHWHWQHVIDQGVDAQKWGFDGEFVNEMHFFDITSAYSEGPNFYGKYFAHCEGREYIMDATPQTLMYPNRVYKFYNDLKYDLSQLKLIVVLREPISREVSCYTHKRGKYDGEKKQWYSDVAFEDGTIKSFEEYANTVLKDHLTPTVSIGKSASLYVKHLQEWMKYFNREQLLVLSFNELKEDPITFSWRIEQFLGNKIPGIPIEHADDRGIDDNEVPLTAWQTLEEIFGPKNEELYQFLDKNHGPWMEQHPFPHFRPA